MMDRPKRVTLSRAKGWRMPPNTVKVDRSTKWGNPFHVFVSGERMRAEDAVEFYRTSLTENGGIFRGRYLATPETVRAELRGKNLACWCKSGEPCHADVLLELANGEAEQ